MSLKTSVLVVAILCGATPASRAALEFRGYSQIGDEALFSLQDTADQSSSPWITVGKTFHDYTLVAFDPKREVLTVKAPDGALAQLFLRATSIEAAKDTRLRISGTITFGTGDDIQPVKATLVMGEETVFDLKDGTSLRLKPSPFQDGNIRYDAVFEKAQDDGTKKKLSSPVIVSRPGQGFSIKTGDVVLKFGP